MNKDDMGFIAMLLSLSSEQMLSVVEDCRRSCNLQSEQAQEFVSMLERLAMQRRATE